MCVTLRNAVKPLVLGCLYLTATQAFAQFAQSPPRLFLSDGKDLARVKALYRAGDKAVAAKVKKLRSRAEQALKVGPFSVVHDRPTRPASGDVHDYLSLSPYSWPDPRKADGLPYILKDGQTNPERDKYDAPLLVKMSGNVRMLALAYYLTDDAPYAEHAAALLRTWYLDPKTSMNPHMNYAGFVPGKNNGGGTGLTDVRHLTLVIDAIGMLQHAETWTQRDQKGIENWYRQFLTWLQTSALGKKEARTVNNHACWYDVHVAACALFVGDTTTAKAVLERVKTHRIATQLEPDGKQPWELKRSKSFHYCVFNLEALFHLATLGDSAGVDLWRYQTQDGRGIRKALAFLVPYALAEQKWPYPQIGPLRIRDMVPLLRRAGNAYADPKYEQAIQEIPDAAPSLDLPDLLYPARK